MTTHIYDYIKDNSNKTSNIVYSTTSKFKTLSEKQKTKIFTEYKNYVENTDLPSGDNKVFTKALSLLGVNEFTEEFHKDETCTIAKTYEELDFALYSKWINMIGSSIKQLKIEILTSCFLSKVDRLHDLRKTLIAKDYNFINRNKVYGHMRSDTRYEPDITIFAWTRNTKDEYVAYAFPFEMVQSFVQHEETFELTWNDQYVARYAKSKIEQFIGCRIDGSSNIVVELAIKTTMKKSQA